MEIKGQGTRLEADRKVGDARIRRTGEGEVRRAGSEVAAEAGGFSGSDRIARVRAVIDALISSPEVRGDVVAEARGKLAAGELDTPEAFRRAAEGFLGR